MKDQVTLDAAWLRRVYHGADPVGFQNFIGRAAVSPAFAIYAKQPATLAVLELTRATYDFGPVAWGHYLHGDFRALRWGMQHAAERGAETFFYPVQLGRPNTAQLYRVLCRRYGFNPYQLLLTKDLRGGNHADMASPGSVADRRITP